MAFYLTLMMGGLRPSTVPKPVLDALTDVQVTTEASSASGFQMKFTFSKNSPIALNYLPSGFFDTNKRVIITVLLNGAPNVLMDGLITDQNLTSSGQTGQSTLTITGSDLTVGMDLLDMTGTPFPGMPPEARVQLILTKYAIFGVSALVIPCIFQIIKSPVEAIAVQKGTDLAYINLLARERGHIFYLDPGPLPGTSVAYWGPGVRVGLPQPALSVDFGAATNVEALDFSQKGLSAENLILTILDPNLKIPIPIPIPDLSLLKPSLTVNQAVALKTKIVSDAGKFGPIEGALYALAEEAGSSDTVSATGQLDVQKYGAVLKARKLVAVRGAGSMYNGLYYVKSVTHNIQVGQYKQSFSLVRGGLLSTISKVTA